jgi:hypothetical protein
MSQGITIGFFYDFDLTLTEEFQQNPIFREYMANLQREYGITSPEQYWGLCSKSDLGIGWMEQMLKDAPNVFEGLSNDALEHEFAPQIKLSDGIPQLFTNITQYGNERTLQLQHHIISLGIVQLIRGTVLSDYVDSISAGEYVDEGNGISRINSVLHPFRKVEILKTICKGQNLHCDIPFDDYNIKHKHIFVIADGQSDIDMFRYCRQRGGIPIAVFKAGDIEGYDRAVRTLGESVKIIAPRDYRDGSTLSSLVREYIDMMVEREEHCDMDPELVHNLLKGHLYNEQVKKVVRTHIEGCQYCRRLDEKRFYKN